MKIGKIVIATLMWVGVALCGYWLYSIIQDPVQFKKDFDRNEAATIERLKDIRVAQSYYLENNKVYANDWDKLVNSLENDVLKVIKTEGDPDDTTVVTTYDTLFIPIRDTIKLASVTDFNDLRYIPYSEGEEFSLETDMLKLQRITVPVYQVVARKGQYLKGLKQEYISQQQDLTLGSLNQATEAGSWQ